MEDLLTSTMRRMKFFAIVNMGRTFEDIEGKESNIF